MSQVAGQAVGGEHAGSGPVDLGTSIGQFVNSSVHTLPTMPPGALAATFVIVVLGLIILKRAF